MSENQFAAESSTLTETENDNPVCSHISNIPPGTKLATEDRIESVPCDGTPETVGLEMCTYCGGTPCSWIELKDEVIQKTIQDLCFEESKTNNQARKLAYRRYIFDRYGYVGKGMRIQLPHCVMSGIRSVWPDANGKYMGFKEA